MLRMVCTRIMFLTRNQLLKLEKVSAYLDMRMAFPGADSAYGVIAIMRRVYVHAEGLLRATFV